ncbi:MAG: polyphenol oxidase family protein [Actinobacteria bacterium]|nr:polyphenol oxidase family protein [Actinomycetota bacterium]
MSESPLFAERQYGEISVAVTSRFGGYSNGPFNSLNLADHVGDEQSAVLNNRELLCQLLNADSLKVLAATHGSDVSVVDAQTQVVPGDGLVTNSKNLGLVALAADCLPFALVDPVAQLVAVGHCGWQGLVAELPKSLADEFLSQGGVPSRSVAVLGPAICGTCYEVPADRVALVGAKCPHAVVDDRHVDITAGVKAQLGEYGFEIEQIAGCTAKSEALYSYRRDGITGRHALAVVIHQREN